MPESAPEASNFIKKETLAQVFSCEFCEISKNNFSIEHLSTTASDPPKISENLWYFLIFSGGIEWENWFKMDYGNKQHYPIAALNTATNYTTL